MTGEPNPHGNVGRLTAPAPDGLSHRARGAAVWAALVAALVLVVGLAVSAASPVSAASFASVAKGVIGGTIVANGPAVSAPLSSTGSAQDDFAFPGVTGEIVTAYASGGTFPPSSVSMVIQSSSGNNVSATVDASHSGFIGETVLPAMDTYTLVVFTNSAVNGTVTVGLSFEPSNGTIVANGPTVTFTSTSPGQGEHYTFPGTAGEVVTASASGGTFPAATMSLVIETSSGANLSAAVDAGQAGSIGNTVLPSMGTYTLDLFPTGAASGSVTLQLSMAPPGTPAPVFTPITPARDLDTRSNTGGTAGPVAGNTTFSLTVAGVNGVPAGGVGAVALNVTVTNPTCAAWITVYPAGQPMSPSSNLNFVAGETVANLVVVGVGTNGQVSFNVPSACAGAVQVVADVQGWYAAQGATPPSGAYTAVAPSRDLDTRSGTGGTSGPVSGNHTFNLTVAGVNGVPTSGVGAVALNVTVANATCAGWLTVFPTGQSVPSSSTLNYWSGATISGLVVVGVGSNGQVSFNVPSACAGAVQVVADVQGWYAAQGATPPSGAYTALAPSRDLDTRSGTGGTSGPVSGNQTFNLTVTGVNGVPASGVGAVALNVTVTNATCASWLTVFSTGQALPSSSTLNYWPGATISNLVVVAVGTNGQASFSVPAACGNTVQVIADVQGWYAS